MSLIHVTVFEDIAENLDSEIGEVYEALGFFLNAEFARAEKSIRTKVERGHPYHNLGQSFLLFIKTLFTFDPEDIKMTLEQLDRTILICNKIVDSEKMSIYEFVSSVVRPQSSKEQTPDMKRLVAHCQLIAAESYLMRAVMAISTDNVEGWMMLVRQSLHIRNSYLFYTNSFSTEHMKDDNFRAAILLGKGVFDLLLPLLPPKVMQVFAFFGFRGDTKLGLAELGESASLSKCVRSPLSSLVILIYHLVVAFILPSVENVQDNAVATLCDSEWFVVCNLILEKGLSEHPYSPIYKYFLGRFLFVQRRLHDAVEVYEGTMKMDIEWPQLKHAGYWEVCLCSLYTLDWERGYKYSKAMAKENKWSKAFYKYLEAVFLWSLDESKIDEVKDLLREVPGLMKKVAGRSIPIEKFVLHRANMVLAENRMPFHPALEITLLWEGISWMTIDDRDTIEKLMIDAFITVSDHEKKGQVLLTLSVIKREKKEYEQSIEFAKDVLKLIVPNDSYCIPLANIELCQTFLEQGDLVLAEKHYHDSVNHKHQYLVKKFMEIRQSRLRIKLERAKTAKSANGQ
jgi:hypothetical protein